MELKKHFLISLILSSSLFSFAQNDLDAIRYSRNGVGGSPRSIAIGGAFGALGADISCASYNPAGLGVYRKGEFTYSGGLRFTNNSSTFNNTNISSPRGNFMFSNFGLAYAYLSEKDATKRNVFSFSNNQLQNFNSNIEIIDGSTTNSMAGDMVTIANEKKNLSQLNPSYELMGYNSYVLDYDSASGKFFSFVDLKRNVSLDRSISTSGRMNEVNISFAQSADDKFYIGGSLGIPRIKYSSTTTHFESDSNDSMKVTLTSASSYSTTYLSDLPFIYTDKLGFNALEYTEYFKTDGYGLNLKLGGLVRVNSHVRVGAYFHTPTIMYLTDVYTYSMQASFDADKLNPVTVGYPDEQGKSIYRVISPMRFGINGAYILNKQCAIALDVENISYNKASISSEVPSDFAGVNAVIKNKYKNATNIRLGGEYTIQSTMLRAGYAYYGSPFGGFFTGPFDRQTLSLGVGIRTKGKMFFDFAWARTVSKEKYYMYSTDPSKTDIKLITSSFIVGIGIKF